MKHICIFKMNFCGGAWYLNSRQSSTSLSFACPICRLRKVYLGASSWFAWTLVDMSCFVKFVLVTKEKTKMKMGQLCGVPNRDECTIAIAESWKRERNQSVCRKFFTTTIGVTAEIANQSDTRREKKYIHKKLRALISELNVVVCARLPSVSPHHSTVHGNCQGFRT